MELNLNEDERLQLIKLAEGGLAECRVEIRHTKSREWREELHAEEELLKGLLGKLGASVAA